MMDPYRRIQIYFRREGSATTLSHLELLRAVETAVDECGLPVRRSEADPPRPRVTFATALPQGMESRMEALEFQVENGPTIRQILDALGPCLPDGLVAFGGDAMYPGEKWRVSELIYEATPKPGSGGGLPEPEETARFLAPREIPFEKRGRRLDLKPLLLRLEPLPGRLRMAIAWTDAGTARPADVLKAMGRDPEVFRMVKVGMAFQTSHGDRILKIEPEVE